MTARLEALRALIPAAEAGTATINDFAAAFPSESAYGTTTWGTAHNAFFGDMNAAFALKDALLPGWSVDISVWGHGRASIACIANTYMRNLSTGQTWYSDEMDSLPVDAGHVMIMVTTGIIFCGIAWVLAIMAFGEAWDRKTWWQRTGPDLLYYGALAFAVMIPERWRKKYNLRRTNLRTSVDREIDSATG